MTKINKNVFVIGSYGRGNIGDDAFLHSINKLITKHKVVINASSDARLPDVTKNFIIIKTEFYSQIIYKLKLFLKTEYVIYGGGDLWVELYEDKLKRKSLWKMLIVNTVCKIFGKKILYIGVGAGKLSGLSLAIARSSARLADKIIFRDHESARLISNSSQVLPDITCMLIDKNYKHKKNDADKTTIGISVMYYIEAPKINFNTYISNLVKELKKFNSSRTKFILYPMLVSNGLFNDDLWASKRLKSLLKEYAIQIHGLRDVDSFINSVKNVDLMIATRLHASILANWVHVPSVGLSYRPKITRYYENIGLEKLALPVPELSNLYDVSKEILSKKNMINFGESYNKGLAARSSYEEIFKDI